MSIQPAPQPITERQTVSLRLLLGAVALCAPPIGWFATILIDMRWELRSINEKLDVLENGSVTRGEMTAWRREYAANPDNGPPPFPWE